MAQSNRLNAPAVKIFIRMLTEDDILPTLNPRGLFWLEGRLLSVDESKNIAVLFDTTGKIKVDYSSVRKLRSQPDDLISANNCVMVIGRIESFPPNALVKAIKMSPISESEVGQVMWEMEVEERHAEVYRERFRKRDRELLPHYPMGY